MHFGKYFQNISSNRQKRLLLLRKFCTVDKKANIASTVDLPLRNPNWASEVVSFPFQKVSNRLFNTEVNIFDKQLNKVIPR